MSVNNILNTSQSGIYASQNTLQTISHNIANANTTGYSRQKVTLVNAPMGLGVQVKDISRQLDHLLDRRQELGMSETGSLDAKSRFLEQIENIFNESNGEGLNSRLGDLFTAADYLVDNPTNPVNREEFITRGQSVANYLQKMDTTLTGLLTPVDKEVDVLLEDVNTRLKAIRDINAVITGRGGSDTPLDLLDQRRQMVLELGKLINIQTLDMPGNGLQIMMAGGQGLLVDSSHAAVLARSTVKNAVDPTDPSKTTDFKGITLDGRDLLRIQGGELGGLIEVRDTLINGKNGFATKLEKLTDEVRYQFNKIGSVSVSRSMNTTQVGAFALGNNLQTAISSLVTDAKSALYAGAPVDLSRSQDGEMVFAVGSDANHLNHVVRVAVTRSMTIQDVVDAINNATDQDGNSGYMSASITTDNHLRIQSATGQYYGTVSDSSNMLAAFGVGVLFNGTAARDMGVNTELLDDSNTLGVGRMVAVYGDPNDPTRITSATFDDGDNQAALAFSRLRDTKVWIGNQNATLTGHYAAISGELGAVINQNNESMSAQQAAQDFLDTLRQSTSGVSMEEELTDLLRYQRSFQACSKMVTTADQMMQTIINMVG
ncbi:flagellar hook-associated protein FlgK [Candidatus Magnetaquicoccus inordinatus]|uniref:flagellar hook-associated protein FlgK n=1 Tax=Candidatus Magnetaquicoccus inordinatus TaxID=2496818 RepID=UPI00187D3050|nr:flagellar hook-associated protein FlgK [Candidatus Magnetaquicoccus inordinatus]